MFMQTSVTETKFSMFFYADDFAVTPEVLG